MAQRKKTIWRYILAGLLVLILLIGGGIYFLIDTQKIKTIIETQVEKATGREFVIDGDLNIAFFPLAQVSLFDVKLKNPTWAKKPYLAEIDRVGVSLKILPLLSGNVQIDTVDIENIKANLEQNKAGQKTWEFKQNAVQAAPAKSIDASSSQEEEKSVLAISNLEIDGGQIEYIDAISATTVIADLATLQMDLSVEEIVAAYGQLKLNKINLDMNPAQSTKSTAILTGAKVNFGYEDSVISINSLDVENTKITHADTKKGMDAQIDLKGLAGDINIAPSIASTGEMRIKDGTIKLVDAGNGIDLKTRLDDAKADFNIGNQETLSEGSVTLKAADLKYSKDGATGSTVLETIRATYKYVNGTVSAKGEIKANDTVANYANVVSGILVEAPVKAIDIKFDLDQNRLASTKGQLALGDVVIKSDTADSPVNKGQVTPGKSSSAPSQGSGRLFSTDPIDISAIRNLNADLVFKADKINLNDQVLMDPQAKLIAANNIIELTETRAGWGDGALKSSARLTTSDPLNLEFKASLEGTTFASVAKALNKSTSVQNGPLRLYVDVAGTGRSQADIARTLRGDVKLDIGEALFTSEYEDFLGNDLVGAILPKVRQKVSDTEEKTLHCVVAHLPVNQGIGSLQTFFVDTKRFNLTGKGTVDLPSERLNIKITPLPKDEKLLEIATPVTISGPLQDPSFSPDTKSVVTKALTGALAAQAGPAAAVLAPLLNLDTAKGALPVPIPGLNTGQEEAVEPPTCEEMRQKVGL